jgi:taurine--2-oxoglutarate transaminase
VAALEAYEEEGLVERSRDLGGRLLAALRSMQGRVPAIGDVRGGHGLFAVVELVRDRATREPLAPWPQVHPSLRTLVAKGREAGVSFAVQGNLVILAPPLVIEETDLMDALGLMERLLTELDWS